MSVNACVRRLACPICGRQIATAGKSMQCQLGHSFDLARQGYVNFLVRQGRGSAAMGDTKVMLEARRRFLDQGHYAPLVKALIEAIRQHLPSKDVLENLTVVDAGCGEGHLINRVHEALTNKTALRSLCTYGVDLSKAAVRLASGRYKSSFFAVSDVKQFLPFADESVNVLLNVFAPRNAKEFGRILSPAGELLVVIPTPFHLQELGGIIRLIGIEEDKRGRTIATLSARFKCVEASRINLTLDLVGAQLRDLVTMTPTHRHLKSADRTALASASDMRVTADFELLRFEKRS